MDNEDATTTPPTINASFSCHSRLKGEFEIQLFNDFYLSVREKLLKRSREFKMELATLEPEATKQTDIAFHWLAAAVICGLASAFFIYQLFSGQALMMPGIGALITAVLSALFVALFIYSSQRQWVFTTRNALYPLIVIPFQHQQQKEAQAFVEKLQQAIKKNVSTRGYSSEDLFAGELRMLRRMAKNRIMSEERYDQAKAHMMKHHGTATAA